MFSTGASPIWKSSAFCGEFADVALNVTEIEDGSVGSTVGVFLGVLHTTLSTPQFALPGLAPADTASLHGFLEPVFRHAARTAAATMGADAPSNDAILAEVAAIRAAIADQAPGTAVGLPCGWRTAKSGHTVFMTVERPRDGTADVRDVHVSNSGQGLQYHPAEHGVAYPNTRYQATLCLPGIPTHRITDEWFLYLLLQNFGTRKETNTAQVLYEVLLPHLAGVTLNEAASASAAAGTAPAADAIDWQTPQRSAVGFYRCLPTALRSVPSHTHIHSA
jgi:hypothetical protein